jgi:hypothetical protein
MNSKRLEDKMNKIIKMADTDYRKADGINNSSLLLFDRSPKHYLLGSKVTKSMQDGIMLHEYLLEGIVDSTLEKKKEDLIQLKENIDNYELIDGLTYKQIADKSGKEISIFWEDPNCFGVQRKGKLDLLFEGEKYNIIIDLKKTTDASDFNYAVRKYKLYRQAAFYSTGVEFLTGKKTIFMFLAFEFSEPFCCKAYMLDDAYLEYGENENIASIIRFTRWKEEGSKIKGYSQGTTIIEKPSWIK